MTQGGSEGSGRPLPPPPVPPRPSKEAVAEAMARSRMNCPVPYGRKPLKKMAPDKPPDPPARAATVVAPQQHQGGKSFKAASPKPARVAPEPASGDAGPDRMSAAFPGVKLNQLDMNHTGGTRQVIFQSPPPSSSAYGREKTPPKTTVSVVGNRPSSEVKTKILDVGPPSPANQGRRETDGPSGESRAPNNTPAVPLATPDQGQPVRRRPSSGDPAPVLKSPKEEHEVTSSTTEDTNGDTSNSRERGMSQSLSNGHSRTTSISSRNGSFSDRELSSDNGVGESDFQVELRHSRSPGCPNGCQSEDVRHGSTSSYSASSGVSCRKYPGGLIAEITRMASLRGLPPLPKSLSGVMDLEGIRLMEAEIGAQAGRSSVAEHHSHRGLPPGPSPSSASQSSQQQDAHHGMGHRHHQIQPLPAHPMPPAPHYMSAHQNGSQEPPPVRGRKQSSLDAQLALLRQEMVGLRQLDLSLLSQLWSLNESIQEFRVLLQEEQEDMGMTLSPPSPSPSPSSGDEDDDDDGNGEFFQPARQQPQQLHYRQKRQRQQQSLPGEGPSGVKPGGGKSGSKKSNPFHLSHNDAGHSSLSKRYPPSSPSSPSSSTRSSFEFGEV
ncbi:protein bassoon [Hetaerina americana]|uniref:protein bassoon n=1 Tax=Hetaerina americana TaxID=62018 RepID=UPI003A7F224D